MIIIKLNTPNHQSYIARHEAQESKKMMAFALSLALATGLVAGAFFMSGIDLALLMNTVNSTKFYVMAGVSALLSILLFLASTERVKNCLSNLFGEPDNRLASDLLPTYPSE